MQGRDNLVITRLRRKRKRRIGKSSVNLETTSQRKSD